MHGPEDPTDEVGILWMLFEFEKGCLEFGKKFGCFFSINLLVDLVLGHDDLSLKELVQFRHAVYCSRERSASIHGHKACGTVLAEYLFDHTE
jgi:hypothetical protein